MKLTTLIAVPLLLLTQGFTLIITTKNGQTVKYETEDIEKMEFESQEPVTPPEDKIQLATPTVLLTTSTPTSATLSWSQIPNATAYRQVLDNGTPVVNSNTSVTLTDLSAGEHTFYVTAISSDSKYTDSKTGSESFTITGTAEAAPKMFTIKSTASKTINATMNAVNETYYVGIVPRSREYLSDEELIAAVNKSPKRQEIAAGNTPSDLQFRGLDPNTNYILVAYPKATGTPVSRYYTRTYIDLTPGSKGFVFAPGVDETSGFIDVDKVGDLSRYGWELYVDESSLEPGDLPANDDGGLCWACTASGMIQWWLNDYKNKTGHDYPIRFPDAIAEKSKCYSTPIMDVMNDAFGWNEGASCMDAIKWFFAGYYNHPVLGNPTNPQYCNTVGAPHKPTYKYWKGGFMGMTWEECMSYIVCTPEANDGFEWYNYEKFYHCNYTIPKDATPEEASKVFSKLTIDAFMEGPVYISFAKHAMSAWGVEYEVLADGTPSITKMYYCENAIHSSNKINGYQITPVEYKPASYPPNLVGRNLVIVSNEIGGEYTLLNCNGLRGWQP